MGRPGPEGLRCRPRTQQLSAGLSLLLPLRTNSGPSIQPLLSLGGDMTEPTMCLFRRK